jgi:hypothetical protein
MKFGKVQLHQHEKYIIYRHGPLFQASGQLPNMKTYARHRTVRKLNITKLTQYSTRTHVNISGVTTLERLMQRGIEGLIRFMRAQTSHLAQKHSHWSCIYDLLFTNIIIAI